MVKNNYKHFLIKSSAAALTLLFLLSALSAVNSSTLKETFDGGESTAVYDSDDKPTLTMPAGAVIFNTSLDISGSISNPDEFTELIPSDQGSGGWYGASAEDPPVSNPANLKTNGFSAGQKNDMSAPNGIYVRTKANMENQGPYHHFSFTVPYPEADIGNMELKWRGKGEEPLVDMLDRYKATIYVWNHQGTNWVQLDSYGLSPSSSLMWLSGNISSHISNYIDNNDEVHLLVRSWIFGTTEAYIDTDYAVLNISYRGGGQYPEGLSLKLKEGGVNVWDYPGVLQGITTLGNSKLKATIQEMSNEAYELGSETLTLTFIIGNSGGGIIQLSNLSVEYGLEPWVDTDAISASFQEDLDPMGLIDLHDHFRDDEALEDLTFEIIYQSQPSKVSAELGANGHTLDFTSEADDWNGEVSMGIRATDTDGLFCEFFNITVTVIPVNDEPFTLGIPHQIWYEDKTCPEDFLDLWNYFGDGGWKEDLVSNMTFTLPPDKNPLLADKTALGSITDNRYFHVIPWYNYNGNVAFVVRAEDRGGDIIEANLTMEIMPTNDPPQFNSTPPEIIDEGKNYTYTPQTWDLDGDALTLTVESGPEGLISNGTGIIWMPEDKDVGIHNISLLLSDSENYTYQNFTLTVRNANDAPVLDEIDPITLEVGDILNLTITADDPDMMIDPFEMLTFTDDCSLFDVGYDTGKIWFKPSWMHIGIHNFTLSVSDGKGLADQIDVTLRITLPNGTSLPEIKVLKPENRTDLVAGEMNDYEIEILNHEIGVNWNITWYYEGNIIGYGLAIDHMFKTPGKHTIKVAAKDGEAELEAEFDVTVDEERKKKKDDSPGFGIILLTTVLSLSLVVYSRRRIRSD